jgi:hypothetical protein
MALAAKLFSHWLHWVMTCGAREIFARMDTVEPVSFFEYFLFGTGNSFQPFCTPHRFFIAPRESHFS